MTLIILSAIVISALIYAVMKVGLPEDARSLKFDETRSRNLQDIRYAIENYIYSKKAIPQTIEELTLYQAESKIDPETGVAYEYIVLDAQKYKLCATFLVDTKAKRQNQPYYREPVSSTSTNIDMTLHPKGYHCFEIEYPKNNGVSYTTNTIETALSNVNKNVKQQTASGSGTSNLSCKTVNTVMTVNAGKGTIGCDVIIEGNFDLNASYCEGQKTKMRNYLTKDYYGRKDYYYATLTNLDPTEEVIIYAASTSGQVTQCSPTLNKS